MAGYFASNWEINAAHFLESTGLALVSQNSTVPDDFPQFAACVEPVAAGFPPLVGPAQAVRANAATITPASGSRLLRSL